MFRLFKKKPQKKQTDTAVENETDQISDDLQESPDVDHSITAKVPEETTIDELNHTLVADGDNTSDVVFVETLEEKKAVPERGPDNIEHNEIVSGETSQQATGNDTSNVKINAIEVENEPEKTSLFSRLREGLKKTGNSITEGMDTLFIGKKQIDDDVMEELENRLLMADLGMDATLRIINNLTQKVEYYELYDSDAMLKAMHEEMVNILRPIAKPLKIDRNHSPTVILMVGINGAGKTTTIGKLAKKFQNQGKSVMLAAGDTFRAAAVEQLQVWGERNNIPVVAQGTGADSASVIFDAMESAKARNIDVLLADTAGRLHTQTNLMEELKKVKRVMQKIDQTAPHEIMLIVDASIGQNALAQAKEFHSALGLTGISVTKLDGTAKGGILFAIAEQTGIPVRYIGVGESIDDLQEFDAAGFTAALLTNSGI